MNTTSNKQEVFLEALENNFQDNSKTDNNSDKLHKTPLTKEGFKAKTIEHEAVVNTFVDKGVSEWKNVPIQDLPCGKYYPHGTKILIRGPRTIDIQNYSLMDEQDPDDIQLKINELLNYCIKIQQGPSTLDYSYLKEADKVYMMIYIRDYGLPGMGYPQLEGTCACGKKFTTDFVHVNVINKTIDPIFEGKFNPKDGQFVLEFGKKHPLCIGYPTIGMKKYLSDVFKKKILLKEVNRSFFEYIPYLYSNDTSIPEEYLDELENDWSSMDNFDYLFIKEACDALIANAGVDKLKGVCSCGQESHVKVRFRGGIKSLFSIPNGFRNLLAQ